MKNISEATRIARRRPMKIENDTAATTITRRARIRSLLFCLGAAALFPEAALAHGSFQPVLLFSAAFLSHLACVAVAIQHRRWLGPIHWTVVIFSIGLWWAFAVVATGLPTLWDWLALSVPWVPFVLPRSAGRREPGG